MLVAVPLYASTSTKTVVRVTVTDKERVVERSGDTVRSSFLVYTDPLHPSGSPEVFENTDSVLIAKWNSRDLQGALKHGHSYRLVVYGWRVPFLSMHRNIARVEAELPTL